MLLCLWYVSAAEYVTGRNSFWTVFLHPVTVQTGLLTLRLDMFVFLITGEFVQEYEACETLITDAPKTTAVPSVSGYTADVATLDYSHS